MPSIVNPERNRRIIALWNTGLSALKVGQIVGASRNTVIGVVFRARANGQKVEERGAPANIVAAAKAKRKPKPAIEVTGPKLSNDPHEAIGCRWIDGEIHDDWEYCQRKTLQDESWCAEHRARVFMKTKFSAAAVERFLERNNAQ